jgi:hypothetical protein
MELWDSKHRTKLRVIFVQFILTKVLKILITRKTMELIESIFRKAQFISHLIDNECYGILSQKTIDSLYTSVSFLLSRDDFRIGHTISITNDQLLQIQIDPIIDIVFIEIVEVVAIE